MIDNFVVIEDDVLLAAQVKFLLELHNFKVHLYHASESYLLDKSLNFKVAIYLIDLQLPGIKGLDMVKLIRLKDKLSPIFILTGNSGDADISECLKAGADDYLLKPYNPDHLMLKILNAQNRISFYEKSTMSIGVKLISEANLVISDGLKIKLTSREYKIMEVLVNEPDKIHSRLNLAKSMGEKDILDRNVDVHICSLRRKISSVDIGIETLRGEGYKIQFGEFKTLTKQGT